MYDVDRQLILLPRSPMIRRETLCMTRLLPRSPMIRRETLCMTQTVETTTEEPNDTTGNIMYDRNIMYDVDS